ncbi:biotin transporter BioY [Gynuella sunshinyii]|uniref:Biotin transporter n=1 Tax=Gynuella sunshinyii YC6258 TaxID=1445510 RepID=A0A0C5UYI2_9GAMM|nr:biotin transporter BioY [Gynuella sunshinyii]AJQ92345.1 hypothetical protein YC6258_00295 [Gynuella sunshinyii YC6258]
MKDKALVEIALYAALIAALGLIPPIPFLSGIPITAQTLGIMLAGIMLGPWRAFVSMALFVLLVAIGMPLLAGGRGGLGVFSGATVGFVIGFPFSAMAVGAFALMFKKLPLVVAVTLASILGGIVVQYMFGIIGFSLMTGKSLLMSTAIMWVYIPGDLVKVVLTAVIVRAVYHSRATAIATR